jgi:hypothetical protein
MFENSGSQILILKAADLQRLFLLMKKLSALGFLILIVACHKDNPSTSTNAGNSRLQHKWTLISRTATFPTSPYPFNGFHEVDAPNDYFDFRKNDSVYSYVTGYLPYSVDTIFYQASSSSITFYVSQSQGNYAFLFETQDTQGHFHDTTTAQIITLNDTLLVLSFPSIDPVTSSVNGTGSTTYYPGTMIDSLKR